MGANEFDEIEDDLSSMMLVSLLLRKEDYFRQSMAERRKSHLFIQLEQFRRGLLADESGGNTGLDTNQFYMKMAENRQMEMALDTSQVDSQNLTAI